jgi:hypothetical protein
MANYGSFQTDRILFETATSIVWSGRRRDAAGAATHAIKIASDSGPLADGAAGSEEDDPALHEHDAALLQSARV